MTIDGEIKRFDNLCEVLQDGTLAPPCSFCALITQFSKLLTIKDPYLEVITNYFGLADCNATINNNIDDAQFMLHKTETECANICLELNAKNTQTI